MAIENEKLNSILNNITKIINDNLVEEPFIEMVLQRLNSFGYTPTENDSWVIAFSIQKVFNHIKNSCNISTIPKELYEVAVDKVCGEFLFSKKQSGQLNAENGFDLETAIKQVQAGDTNVTFAIGEGSETVETRLNKLIAYLIDAGEGDLICYRQLKW